MIQPLATLARIQLGTTQLRDEGEGGVPLVQVGAFDKYGRIIPDNPRPFSTTTADIPQRAWVKPGDVLLAGKGSRNTAVYYRHEYPVAVASAAFFILRVIEPALLLPEFLACYLNQPEPQAQMKNLVSSSITVPTLNKRDLLDLRIPLPPLVVQRRLVNFYNAFLEIHDLNQHLTNQYEKLLHQCFFQTISPDLNNPE